MFLGHEFSLPFRICFSSVVSLATQNLGISFVLSGHLALIDLFDQVVEFILSCYLERKYMRAFLQAEELLPGAEFVTLFP
jgi:hypothetical protein